MASSSKTVLPNDARLISLMLAAKGVEDADERVLYQLLDFAHRYTAELISDATAYSEHAGRSGKLIVGDVELAVKSRSAWEFEEGPPKDYLLPLAKQLNSMPLPQFDSSFTHIRLPPKHLMLGNANFRLIPNRPDGTPIRPAEEEEEDEDDEEEEESQEDEEMQEIGEEDLDVEMDDDLEGGDLDDGDAEGEEEEELEDNDEGRRMAEEERGGLKRSREEMEADGDDDGEL